MIRALLCHSNCQTPAFLPPSPNRINATWGCPPCHRTLWQISCANCPRLFC